MNAPLWDYPIRPEGRPDPELGANIVNLPDSEYARDADDR